MVKDITGQTYGLLTVVSLARTGRRGSVWNCRCECGSETEAHRYKLLQGRKKSCGCLWVRHGRYVRQDPLAGVWKQMKQRCGNARNKDCRYYGAKGIRVCAEWKTLLGFKRWAYMAGYLPGLTIDRINADQDYTPANCRWVPPKENTRRQKHEKAVAKANPLPAAERMEPLPGAHQGDAADGLRGQEPALAAEQLRKRPLMLADINGQANRPQVNS